jgi:hypothetical protein
MDHLPRLDLTARAVREVLRLYPPAALARDWDSQLDALKDHLDRSASGPASTTFPVHETQ